MSEIEEITESKDYYKQKYYQTLDLLEISQEKLDSLQELLDDLKQTVEDNYKQIPVGELYGVSDSDFI